MKINLSKKNKVIVITLLVLVLGGTGGYLLWRVNQDKNLAPDDSDASGCHTVCTGSWSDQNCAHGSDGCECGEGEIGSEASNGNLQCCGNHEEVCDATCGDKSCNGSETLATCPGDCAKCGDNICTSPTETLANCPGDCSVCGDNKCTGTETATSCASDCACKAFVWSSKPSGSYTPTTVPSAVTITNPNSATTETTGIVVKLNESTIGSCTSSGGGATGIASGVRCYTASVSSGQQKLTFGLLAMTSSTPSLTVGTYTLSVSLPGAKDSCIETASFTVAEDVVIVVPEDEEVVVPATGLFDGVMSKIYLGTGFVFLGVMTTQFSKFGYLFNTLGERNRVVLEEKKRKREEDKRNRFEKRFK